MVDADLGAEGFEPAEVEVDGSDADGAAAGERDVGLLAAGDEGPENADRRAHGRDDLVGRLDRALVDEGDVEALAVALDAAAERLEELDHRADVAEVGNIVKGEDVALVHEERGGHHGQGGVLGALDAGGALERTAALDDELVHGIPLVLYSL